VYAYEPKRGTAPIKLAARVKEGYAHAADTFDECKSNADWLTHRLISRI
jgi:hypothetical protein